MTTGGQGGGGGGGEPSLLAKISTPLSRKIHPPSEMDLTPPHFFVPAQNFHDNTMENPPYGLILGFTYSIYKKNSTVAQLLFTFLKGT